LKTRVVLSIDCYGIEVGKELTRVLTPDNEGPPRGLDIMMRARKGKVGFEITSDSPSTSLSTVLAILRDVSLFEQVWLLSRGQEA